MNSSQNGSPIAASDAGSVLATVCKKRKGNGIDDIAVNLGEGVMVHNANDLKGLDDEMRRTAVSQIKILRDQMDSILAQAGEL